jgi:hypothetical protein
MPTSRSILLRGLSLGLYLLFCLDQSSPASDLTSAAAQHGATVQDANRAGIWKSATPPSGSMHGEFDNNDPIGLAAGSKIPADCSLNWVDPDFHKLYCFSSATSLVYFLDSPRAFLARARKNWAALSPSG